MTKIRNKRAGHQNRSHQNEKGRHEQLMPTSQATEVKWTDCIRNAKHQNGFKNKEKI